MYRMGWTDERMDDFARHTDQRFDAVDRRLDQLDDRFAALQRTLVMASGAIIAALIGLSGLIATQL
jgi:DNA anti-recombination protein RmuC